MTARLPVPRETWRKYLTDYNEGLGLVYERVMLNSFLLRLADRYTIQSALEAPLYGMAGVSGINSVCLARRGIAVTLLDSDQERLAGVRRIWQELGLRMNAQCQDNLARLPFEHDSYDLAWNWAALWYLPDPAALIRELVRVSRQLVFIAMPNRLQVGYLLRKYILEKDFVNYVDERWADAGRIRRALVDAGATIIEQGVLDVPPWPDTVMPAAQVLAKLGLRSKQFSEASWNWSTMDYYTGRRPELGAQMERYAFLERAPLPWQLKSIWAHHRYVLARV